MSDDYISKLVLWGQFDKALEQLNFWYEKEGYSTRTKGHKILADAVADDIRSFYGPSCFCHVFFDPRENEYTYRFRLVGGCVYDACFAGCDGEN